MSRFLNMLPVRTRAVIPDYSSQWRDYLQVFDNVSSTVDWLEAGYPYSIYDLQIVGGLPEGIMFTISGDPMVTIVDQEFMEVI